MSITSDVMFDTRPATITGMVQQYRKKHGLNPKHRYLPQDEIQTEVLVSARLGHAVSSRRRAKHRDTPVQASLFIRESKGPARHKDIPFSRPKSLFELLNGGI